MYTHMHKHIHTHTCTHSDTHIHMYTHAHTHTHTDTCTHTRTHTQTHTPSHLSIVMIYKDVPGAVVLQVGDLEAMLVANLSCLEGCIYVLNFHHSFWFSGLHREKYTHTHTHTH